MHMNLRRTVRLPQRLEQDHILMPLSQRSLREDISIPRYIDYNPNLPPAAFPTLDRPRVSGSDTHNTNEGNTEGESGEAAYKSISRSLDDLCLLTYPERQREASPTAELDDVPADRLENYIASNGSLNPTWTGNMARMAGTVEDANEDADMEDPGADRITAQGPQSSSRSPRNPSWGDLSCRMQVEIFGNLLERYSYFTVCRLLGLTSRERNGIENAMKSRREQVEYEESQLRSMRAKQLRELSKLDNSSRRRCQSQQLSFRKASRQTFRGLNEAISPDADFFSCDASEVATARTFLRKQELEAKFAGVWGNNLSLVRNSENEAPLEAFGLDGGPGPNLFSRVDRTPDKPQILPTLVDDFQLEPSLVFKEQFSSWIGNLPSVTRMVHYPPIGRFTTPAEWLTFLYNEIEFERQYGTKRKEQQQANIRGSPGWRNTSPVSLVVPMHSLDDFVSEDLALTSLQQRSSSALDCNTALPFPKRLVGLKQHVSHQPVRIPRSSSELPSQRPETLDQLYRRASLNRDKSTKSGQDTQMQDAESVQSLPLLTGDGIDSQDMEDYLSDTTTAETFLCLSSPSTPAQRMTRQSSSPGTDLFELSESPSSGTVSPHVTPPTSVNGAVSSEYEDGDWEDEAMHDDEMVLLPQGSRAECF